ncbi:hypothetical protein ACPX19_10495 [Winogradskyella sp. HB-48]|uniref:hypothetical protein n=1 Tax=Winogradskyella sp. HB-48 TaxID=3416808 RepID=UPI003CF78299
MRLIAVLLFGCFSLINVNAQSCSELLELVKSKSYGVTYYSYDSEAISQVTFYEVSENYETYYFAVVRFTSSYKQYIYQVGSNTKFNYSLNYMDSAGKAFWNYIHPYNDVLGCAPNFD